MLLSEPQPTGGDLHFEIAGVRVRVSVWFWLAAALMGWGVCQAFSLGDQRRLLTFLGMWIVSVFLSILVHELGHALAYRAFGQDAHVVLYHFGGLTSPASWGRRHLRPTQRLLVSAAGPAAQLALAAAIVMVLRAGGYAAPFPFPGIGRLLGLYDGRAIPSEGVAVLCDFLLYINIFWPLLNLVPVPPLDGGQIVREGLVAIGIDDGPRIASIIGVFTGAALAWWGYTRGQPYLGIMFAMLAVSCFQSLSNDTPWRRWN
jgi:stage IV sporulation protein FB